MERSFDITSWPTTSDIQKQTNPHHGSSTTSAEPTESTDKTLSACVDPLQESAGWESATQWRMVPRKWSWGLAMTLCAG